MTALRKSNTTNIFNFQANENNPLGLFKNNGKIYQVLGFFTFMDTKELMCDLRGSLPMSVVASDFQLWGTKGNDMFCDPFSVFAPSIPISGGGINRNFRPAVNAMLTHLGLEPKECFAFDTEYNLIFVFSIYREEVSIFEQYTKSPKQALWDYISQNEEIPEIMSPNRIAEEIARSAAKTVRVSNYQKHVVNIDTLRDVLYSDFSGKPVDGSVRTVKIKQETVEEKQQREYETEPSFKLCEDYEEKSKHLGLDLFDIQKRVNAQAKRKGGFVEFTYKDITYKIPKIPLLAWAYRDCQHTNKYTINGETWYPVSADSIKTDEDNPYHSDWWIGAGFPLSIYELAYRGHNFASFNRALSLFAYSLVKDVGLEDIIILAGDNLPSVSGKLSIYPQSINDFDEDDIIVLSHGGVEFDSFIKKACKNGKGGVIVEIDNKVSHLKIVSNEMNSKGHNFRLVCLPRASGLLKTFSYVKLNTQKRNIKPIISE